MLLIALLSLLPLVERLVTAWPFLPASILAISQAYVCLEKPIKHQPVRPSDRCHCRTWLRRSCC